MNKMTENRTVETVEVVGPAGRIVIESDQLDSYQARGYTVWVPEKKAKKAAKKGGE